MYKKYYGTNHIVEDENSLYDRSDVFKTLDDYLKKGKDCPNIAIFGVKGVGKSSLLNCYFTTEKKKKIAQDYRLLVYKTDAALFAGTRLDLYEYLADGVYGAIEVLNQDRLKSKYEKIKQDYAERMAKCNEPASKFQAACDIIKDAGFYIILVIDAFEKFIESNNVTPEHHSMLNSLIAQNLRFIVATDYGFEEDLLPRRIRGSLLIQKFQDNIYLSGLSETACAKYTEGDFSNDELNGLRELSGGIPVILKIAAEYAYRPASTANGGPDTHSTPPIDWKELFDKVYEDRRVSNQLDHWCRRLTSDQKRVLNDIVKGDSSFEDGTKKSAAEDLLKRGLLRHTVDDQGIEQDTLFSFSTPLLKQFFRSHYGENPNVTLTRPTDLMLL